MTDLEFDKLEWTYLIWFAMAFGISLIFLEIRHQKQGSQFVSPEMQVKMARTSSLSTRIFSHICLSLALICFVVALMRPQYGFMERRVPHVGAQIMICLDVSKSMLAEDTAPNRLERAKSELEVLLSYLEGDQVGLIAFAGKATVLCPMTTDFSFLKMVLREASPTSVGRGGTLLEEPIRQASIGFSDTSGMSKVIVLITDGEDNGSKPIDAAQHAAEQGIKIITIGFGDEAGAKIEVTDPRTGLTSYIKGPDGKDVISRLDISTLTRIATLTSGAFIPARTGSLDVESIYQDHIQPLMRASSTTKQVVKNEAFQWPLLVGVILFTISVLTSNALAFARSTFGEWLEAKTLAKTILFVALLGNSDTSYAQSHPGPKEKSESADASNQGASSQPMGGEFASRKLEDLVPEDPTECYNLSADILRKDVQFAEKLLEAARRNAGSNAELRFRSCYNLGWVKVTQADQQLSDEKPEEALDALKSSANWFREAIRLRPNSIQSRENLEIVLQRITELADSINREEPKDFAGELDELIQRQSNLLQVYRDLLHRVSREDQATFSEQLSQSFRLASVDQRLLNSDLQEVNRKASEMVAELRRQQATKQSTDPAEQQQVLRLAQVEQALIYSERAIQRLGQARSQLRFKNAKRAALRSSLGLDELKRARDQLRNPAEILRQIIADSQLLNQQTKALAAGKNTIAAFLGNQIELPEWLDPEYLMQFQQTQTERTEELAGLLNAAAKQGNPTAPSLSSDQDPDPNLQKLASLAAAARLVDEAKNEFLTSHQQLNDHKIFQADPAQQRAITKLKQAYELFADLKGLLEITYAAQAQTTLNLQSATRLPEKARLQVSPELAAQIQTNLERAQRIKNLISEKAAAQDSQSTAGSTDPARPSHSSQDHEKLQLAQSLIEEVLENLAAIGNQLEEPANVKDEDWMSLHQQSLLAENRLNELRRLFFSIVERLRETAGRQNRLNGETRDSLDPIENKLQANPSQQTDAQIDAERAKEREKERTKKIEQVLAPLRSRQNELAAATAEIGDSLQQTADTSQRITPTDQSQGGQLDDRQKQQLELLEKYEQAAALVNEGQTAMDQGAAEMGNKDADFELIKSKQGIALEKLVEALQLLQPPDQNQDQENQESGNNEESDPAEGQSGEGKQENAQDTAAQRMLQGVRDREAQRRNERNQGKYQERVEKDW